MVHSNVTRVVVVLWQLPQLLKALLQHWWGSVAHTTTTDTSNAETVLYNNININSIMSSEMYSNCYRHNILSGCIGNMNKLTSWWRGFVCWLLWAVNRKRHSHFNVMYRCAVIVVGFWCRLTHSFTMTNSSRSLGELLSRIVLIKANHIPWLGG